MTDLKLTSGTGADVEGGGEAIPKLAGIRDAVKRFFGAGERDPPEPLNPSASCAYQRPLGGVASRSRRDLRASPWMIFHYLHVSGLRRGLGGAGGSFRGQGSGATEHPPTSGRAQRPQAECCYGSRPLLN